MATNNTTNTSANVTVPQGGTSVTTLTTAYGVLCAGTTATGAVQTLSSLGAMGTVLTSNGAGALPSFQNSPAGFGINIGAISTNWYPSGSTFGGTGGTSQLSQSRATGTLYFHPFFLTKTTTFTNIGILVGSTTAAGTSVLGLYYDNGNSAPFGDPIANSNSTSLTNTTSTFSSYTFGTAITLNAGLYWTAHSTSGTTNFVGTSSEVGGRGLGVNATPTATNILTPVCGWSQSFVYSATLPSVGSLSSTLSYAAGDVYVFLQAQ